MDLISTSHTHRPDVVRDRGPAPEEKPFLSEEFQDFLDSKLRQDVVTNPQDFISQNVFIY